MNQNNPKGGQGGQGNRGNDQKGTHGGGQGQGSGETSDADMLGDE